MSSISKMMKKEYCPGLGCKIYISGPGALRLLRLHWEETHMKTNPNTCPVIKGRLIHPSAVAKRTCGECGACTANKTKEVKRRRVHRRCHGEEKCAGCSTSMPCLSCLHCIDKKGHGGQNIIRKRCIWKMCVRNLTERDAKQWQKAMDVYNKNN